MRRSLRETWAMDVPRRHLRPRPGGRSCKSAHPPAARRPRRARHGGAAGRVNRVRRRRGPCGLARRAGRRGWGWETIAMRKADACSRRRPPGRARDAAASGALENLFLCPPAKRGGPVQQPLLFRAETDGRRARSGLPACRRAKRVASPIFQPEPLREPAIAALRPISRFASLPGQFGHIAGAPQVNS